ncbi:hypothetical protein AALA00_05220 [Lachnospiraceae bacterium 46-15]
MKWKRYLAGFLAVVMIFSVIQANSVIAAVDNDGTVRGQKAGDEKLDTREIENTTDTTKGDSDTEPETKPLPQILELEASWSEAERDPIILRYTIENEWAYVKIL